MTCPSDCVVRSLETNSHGNSHASGYMFSVTASVFGEVHIRSLDVVGKKEGSDQCEVYTRPGDFNGYEEDASAWALVLENDDVALLRSVPSSLGELDKEVLIPAGSKQSFYIFCARGMLMYRKIDNKNNYAEDGAVYADQSVVIHDGVVTKKLFDHVEGNGKYSGGLRYYESASPMKASSGQ